MSAYKRTRAAITSAYQALLEATPEQLQYMNHAIASTGVSATEAFKSLSSVGLTPTNPEKEQA